MKVLILGGTGMLGHKLYSVLKEKYEVFTTIRGNFNHYEKYNIFNRENVFENIKAENFDSFISIVSTLKPEIVINCIGIIKQLPESKDPIKSIQINALLPHQLSLLCEKLNIRFIHISTDCVFSGKKGNYLEEDISDAEDLYGRTKFLGEISDKPHTVTLRTSMIGRELNSKNGLVEWFLNSKDKVYGYKNAIFSGLTTNELSKVIMNFIIPYNDISGIYNISTYPISKYELLSIIKKIYGLKVEVIEDRTFSINRSLNGNKFIAQSGYQLKNWEQLIYEMKEEE